MKRNSIPSPSNVKDVGFRSLLTVAALVIVVAGLKAAASVLLPVLLAAFLAVLSFPPIAWLHRHRVPMALAVLLVFTGVLVAFVGISVLIGSSVGSFSQNIPFYQQRIEDKLAPLLAVAQGYGIDVSADVIRDNLSASRLMTWVAGGLRAVSSILSDTFFVLLTTVFIIAEAAGVPRKIRAILGQPDADLGRFSHIVEDLQGYLGIKTQVSLVTGLLAGGVAFAAGVDYAILWGFVAFLLNFVPTLGSIIAAIPPSLLALVQFGWQRAALVIVGYVAVNIIMGNVIEPRLMGRRLGLSTLVVFLSLVFWGFVWGPLGMLLCVPLTMMVKILLQNSDDLQWVAILLGSGAELRDPRNTKVPPPAPPSSPGEALETDG
jgi:predicted PurR-regulated permease PerM